MWRYTPAPFLKITSNLLAKVEKKLCPYDKVTTQYTDEALVFLNSLYQPYIEVLNRISTTEEFEEFVTSLEQIIKISSSICSTPDFYVLQARKEEFLRGLLEPLFVNELTGEGISSNSNIIDVWIIKDYIRNNKVTRQLFHLPRHRYDHLLDEEVTQFDDPDPDYEETPVTIPITVSINETQTEIEMTNNLLLGIMAVYRYLRIMHPLSYNNLIFSNEMEKVNNIVDDFASGRSHPHGL